MQCISFGLLIVATISIIIVSAIAGIWVPFAGTIGGLATTGLFIWWIAGFFMKCDDTKVFWK